MPKNSSLDDIKTPLFAAVGAGDLALAAVADVVGKIRERAEDAASEAADRVGETRNLITKISDDLPEGINDLRNKFSPEELRKVAEAYAQVATGIYNSLAERGEEAYARLRQQPGFEENIGKAESYLGDAVELTEQALGTVASQTRAVGERAAKLATKAGLRVAEAGEELGEEIADAGVAVENAAKSASKKVVETAKIVDTSNDSAKQAVKKAVAKATPAKVSPAKKAPVKKATATRAPVKKATPRSSS
ncbi:MAG: heparin-binding hemagglutinin [Mycobacteriaceae bacterium]